MVQSSFTLRCLRCGAKTRGVSLCIAGTRADARYLRCAATQRLGATCSTSRCATCVASPGSATRNPRLDLPNSACVAPPGQAQRCLASRCVACVA